MKLQKVYLALVVRITLCCLSAKVAAIQKNNGSTSSGNVNVAFNEIPLCLV